MVRVLRSQLGRSACILAADSDLFTVYMVCFSVPRGTIPDTKIRDWALIFSVHGADFYL